MALFVNCGLFWLLDDVYFGKSGRGGHKGQLLGKRESKPMKQPIDFSSQIGVYALYADFDLLYVGEVGGGEGNRLLNRIRQHSNGDLKGRWNRFSWFGLRRVLNAGSLSKENASFHPSRSDVLRHVEGIVLQFAEPPLNGQKGRFKDSLERYIQVRHDKLGPTKSEMLTKLYKDS